MEMSHTAARLLGLLSLLMVPRTWSGRELADRLGVSPRTVRNDIGALRDIGYTIEGTRGNEGGYRLSPYGSAVPPLLFDSDEAVAVAVGLRSGLSCIIGGMEETSARALAKLESILPSALRARLQNLAHFTVPVAGNQPMPIVDPELIVVLIDHCQRQERLRFIYRGEEPADPARLDPARPIAEPRALHRSRRRKPADADRRSRTHRRPHRPLSASGAPALHLPRRGPRRSGPPRRRRTGQRRGGGEHLGRSPGGRALSARQPAAPLVLAHLRSGPSRLADLPRRTHLAEDPQRGPLRASPAAGRGHRRLRRAAYLRSPLAALGRSHRRGARRRGDGRPGLRRRIGRSPRRRTLTGDHRRAERGDHGADSGAAGCRLHRRRQSRAVRMPAGIVAATRAGCAEEQPRRSFGSDLEQIGMKTTIQTTYHCGNVRNFAGMTG